MSAPDPTKAPLRRSLLAQRHALTLDDWRTRSDRLCAHLQAASLFQQAKTVLAYVSVRQEPDLTPLFTQPKQWGLPRCVGENLVWHRVNPLDPADLQPGAYGIPAPVPTCPQLAPTDVDLLLVPALACDREGYRLGYGGGFYDRLFSDRAWAAIPSIGIVFACGQVERLPRDEWDHPLMGVCSDAGFSLF